MKNGTNACITCLHVISKYSLNFVCCTHVMFQFAELLKCFLLTFFCGCASVVCIVQQLSESLDEFGEKWELNPADGAFYGPKV